MATNPKTGRSCQVPDHTEQSAPYDFTTLPFVYRPKRGFKNASNWKVEPTDNYALALHYGEWYGAEFMHYLWSDPNRAGGSSLGLIAAAIDYQDKSGASGYWVGFFSHLERVLCQR
ncbi:hypothetical protein [Proteus mirabilis]|uniref:hypothetical protein n=1 Tax=Proteus mirabilis TaxID=584 RepID=UPI0034D4BCAD